MTRTLKVAITNMPRLLLGIIEDVFARQPHVEVVGTSCSPSTPTLDDGLEPDVLLVSCDDLDLGSLRRSKNSKAAALRIVLVGNSGATGAAFDVTQPGPEIEDLSSQDLLEAVGLLTRNATYSAAFGPAQEPPRS